MTAIEIDAWDYDAFQRQEHHDFLAELRETDPGIHWVTEGDNGPGFWAITRHEHLREVNRQADIFSSNARGTQMHEPDDDEASAYQRDHVLIEMDGEPHTRYRKLVNRGFTPRMIALLEDYLENRTQQILDQVTPEGECEFVTEVSSELPLQAIAEMMGIPVEDRSKIFDWTNRMVGNADPDFSGGPDEAMDAIVELMTYSHQLQTDRREEPADDIVTTLLQADIDGEKLEEIEFDMFFLVLCVAGNETTRNSITRGMMGFFDFPDQWAKFVGDPDRYMDGAIDEIIRWATPVLHFRRQALEDYELGGVQIKAGEKVVMWHVAANRDPRVFDDPWAFDIERDPNDHIAFGGGGPHYCLGANLARMEIRLMFQAIAERMPDIHRAGEPRYLRSNFIGGIKALPVAYTASPSRNTPALHRLGSAAGASGTTGFGGDVERR